MLGINRLGSGPAGPVLERRLEEGCGQDRVVCPCPHRGFADGVWPLMHGALQYPEMILGWPDLCVAGKAIS